MNKKTKRRPSGGTKHQKRKSLKNKKKSSTRNYDDTKMMMNFVLDSLVRGFRNFFNYFFFIKPTKNDKLTPTIDFIAMDCEMVGCGKKGSESLLARCSLVALSESKPSNLDNNQDATVQINVVYDVYVKPTKHVTDYRTQYSGITVEHLGRDEAVSWDACHSHVKKILKSTENRTVVLIGHGLENDFQVLKYWHPRRFVRDTATFHPFMRQGHRKMLPRKLSSLAEEHLGLNIQGNKGINANNNSFNININYGEFPYASKYGENSEGHCSVEDAAATLLLYRKFSQQWEETLGSPLQ